jgi:ribosomal-protein-alanine N-acetyltransferase
MSSRTDDWVVERLTPASNLEDVLAIERASFTNPWTWEMFAGELYNDPVSRIYVLRSRDGGPALAFCSVWLVAGELHINNLAVEPEHRGRGLGRRLLADVLDEAARRGASRATLEVRRSNRVAIHLYEQMGFAEAGVRRAYYTNPVEDALILWKTGLDTARMPGRVAP